MMPVGKTLLVAHTLITLTLCSVLHPAHAFPLPSAHPQLEQELKSLTAQPPLQGVPGEDVLTPLTPSTFNDEALHDVLQHNQDIGKNGGVEAEDDSLPVAGGESASDTKSPSSGPTESQEEELQSLNALIREEQFQPLNSYAGGYSPESELLSLNSQKQNSYDNDLQTIRAEVHEFEEEADDMEDQSLADRTDREESEGAVRQLEVLQPGWKASFRASDEYDGYDSDDDERWMEVDDDDEKSEKSSRTFQVPPVVNGQGYEDPEPVWKAEETRGTRPSFDDVMAAEDADAVGHDDVQRGKTMEVPGFAPLRVIELNETLYLNKTDDDHLPKFQPVPIPDKFEDYDVNGDGMISLPELRYVTRATEGARLAFRDADTDGDGWVDREEFQGAGWGMPIDSASPSQQS